MAIASEQGREVNWRACAADLAQGYRDKCTPNVAAARPIASQTDVARTGGEDEPEGGPSSSTPASTQPQSQPERRVWNPFARPLSSSSASSSQTGIHRKPPRPQHLRAYNLWHRRDMPLADICAALRSKDQPLAESTVMYVFQSSAEHDN